MDGACMQAHRKILTEPIHTALVRAMKTYANSEFHSEEDSLVFVA